MFAAEGTNAHGCPLHEALADTRAPSPCTLTWIAQPE